MAVVGPNRRVKVAVSIAPPICAAVERVAVAERRSRSSAVEVLLAEALECRRNAAEWPVAARTAPAAGDDTGAAVVAGGGDA